jgi:hypothetical protein
VTRFADANLIIERKISINRFNIRRRDGKLQGY